MGQTRNRGLGEEQVASRRGPKKITDDHKHAMAAGRTEAAIVNRYLATFADSRQHGRRIDAETLRKRLAEAEARRNSSVGVERLVAAQEARDIRAKLGQIKSGEANGVEKDFIRIAKQFSERRGISYDAWRDVGVPARVLSKAGITRRD